MTDLDHPDIIRILELTKIRADVQTKRNRIRQRLLYWEGIYDTRRLRNEIKTTERLTRNSGSMLARTVASQRLIQLNHRATWSRKIPKKHETSDLRKLKKKVLELKLDFARVQLEICNVTNNTANELRQLLNKHGLSIHRKHGGALISHIETKRSKREQGGWIKLDTKRIEEILLDKDIEKILLGGKCED